MLKIEQLDRLLDRTAQEDSLYTSIYLLKQGVVLSSREVILSTYSTLPFLSTAPAEDDQLKFLLRFHITLSNAAVLDNASVLLSQKYCLFVR